MKEPRGICLPILHAAASLRTHLMVLVLLIMVPATLVAVMAIHRIGESYRLASESYLRDAANGMALAFEQTVDMQLSAMRVFAESPLLDANNTDIATLYAQAESLGRNFGTYVVITRDDLQQIVNTSRPFGTPLPHNAPDGPASRTFRSGAPFISDVYIGRVSGRGVVSLFLPVYRAGRPIRVIDMPLDPSRLERMIRKLNPAEGLVAVLSDSKNRIITRSQDFNRHATIEMPPWYGETLAGNQEGIATGPSLEGVPHVYAYKKLSNAPWTVAVAQPVSTFSERWRVPLFRVALGGATLLGLGLLLAARVATRLIRPVNALTRNAEAFPIDGIVQDLPRTSVLEFRRLQTALAHTANLLRQEGEAHRLSAEAAKVAKAEADQANLAKTKFLAAASHDLRQPVQALSLLIEAAKTRSPSSLQPNLLKLMEQALDGLKMLLDSLLDVSRLDAGIIVPEIKSVPLTDILDRLKGEYGVRAGDKALRLRVRPSLWSVRADASLLEQVLRNFLDNAIRFTERGGILVGCRRQRETVWIEVWDTGIGIAPEHKDAIFDEFHQIGNPARDRRMGLGLGLAIVKRSADLIGAKVEVCSVPGTGSRFSLGVPLATTSTMVQQDRSEYSEQTKRILRVLIIDDEPLVAQALTLMLEERKCDVLTAFSGEEAATKIRSGTWKPDLILSDYRLGPGWNGLQSIREIEAICDRQVPGVVITGDTAPERIQEVHGGGYMLLHKPVSISALDNIVREVKATQRSALSR